MNTTIKEIEELTISEFADKHGLEMVVTERRRPKDDPGRYYATFKGCEVKDGGILISAFGDGNTPEKAIQDYIPRIELHRIVLNSFSSNRVEIDVPRLSHGIHSTTA